MRPPASIDSILKMTKELFQDAELVFSEPKVLYQSNAILGAPLYIHLMLVKWAPHIYEVVVAELADDGGVSDFPNIVFSKDIDDLKFSLKETASNHTVLIQDGPDTHYIAIETALRFWQFVSAVSAAKLSVLEFRNTQAH